MTGVEKHVGEKYVCVAEAAHTTGLRLAYFGNYLFISPQRKERTPKLVVEGEDLSQNLAPKELGPRAVASRRAQGTRSVWGRAMGRVHYLSHSWVRKLKKLLLY